MYSNKTVNDMQIIRLFFIKLYTYVATLRSLGLSDDNTEAAETFCWTFDKFFDMEH